MKRLGAVILVCLGLGLVCLGLLFLMGAGGRAHRFAIAVVSLALGGALAGLGVRLFKDAEAMSPETIRAELLDLARQHLGEITEAEVLARLGRRASGAPAVLSVMETEGICQRRSAPDGGATYRFPDLQARLLVRRCEYCQAELPLQADLAACPNCGGTVKTELERRSVADSGAYRMDD